jgi:hypothetical protein
MLGAMRTWQLPLVNAPDCRSNGMMSLGHPRLDTGVGGCLLPDLGPGHEVLKDHPQKHQCTGGRGEGPSPHRYCPDLL